MKLDTRYRIIAALVALTTIFAMTACNSETEANVTEAATIVTTTEETTIEETTTAAEETTVPKTELDKEMFDSLIEANEELEAEILATLNEDETMPEEESTADSAVSEDNENDITGAEAETEPVNVTISEATETTVPAIEALAWSETAYVKTMYTTADCFSRVNAIIGSDTVLYYPVGTQVEVVAKTDTSYCKLDTGAFIHADYLSEEKVEVEIEPTPQPVVTNPPYNPNPAPSGTTNEQGLNDEEVAMSLFAEDAGLEWSPGTETDSPDPTWENIEWN